MLWLNDMEISKLFCGTFQFSSHMILRYRYNYITTHAFFNFDSSMIEGRVHSSSYTCVKVKFSLSLKNM